MEKPPKGRDWEWFELVILSPVPSALERLYSIYREFYLLTLTSPPQRGLGEPQGSLVEPLAEGVSMNIFGLDCM